ncbi:MAG TPA: molybdopterin dinucleotide binding domain-containing protein [Gemmatimonadales bacterium]|jgi:formylmethanofuran dehydrogenase subunit D|nr:molybdopterin dinucleotide binding domain-containing protein [Gemmatimonadales bacterium]
MTLIGGRSSKQGTSLCAGKLGAEYLQISSTVEMNVEDMARLGLSNDSKVRLRTPMGEVVLRCKGRETKDLPPGLLFMAYGPFSSELMAGDTGATGMPISKNLDVEVEPVVDGAAASGEPQHG